MANGYKILWVGDAVAPTGFARVSEAIGRGLYQRGWDLAQLAINYWGDPHELPWRLYPAGAAGHDLLGIQRLAPVYAKEQPNLVVMLGDPWIVAPYLRQLPGDAKTVAYLPVDAQNQWAAGDLNALSLAIAYTRYGAQQLRLGGYTGPLTTVPHRVDTTVFYPEDRWEARKLLAFDQLGFTETSFIVGNVNRNQPRKRLDLTIAYFAKWWKRRGCPENAYLLVHCALEDHAGWNLINLAKHFGVHQRIIFTGGHTLQTPSTVDRMRHIYSACNVGINTGLGEGWGLTAMEFMACGTATLLPINGALPEWADGAACFVPCSNIEVQPASGIHTVGGVMDPDGFVTALNVYYDDPDLVKAYGECGLARVREPQYDWTNVCDQFDAALKKVIA